MAPEQEAVCALESNVPRSALSKWQRSLNMTGSGLPGSEERPCLRRTGKRPGLPGKRVAPLLPDFPFDPADVQWIGGTVDCVVWDGLTSDGEIEVVFLDVKTGKAVLNQRQRRIRKAIEAGRVRFEVFRPQLAAELAVQELTPEFLNSP